MVGSGGHFVWYELMTTDVESAKAFYAKVLGWRARDASAPNMPYVLLTAGETPVSGLMGPPPGAPRSGVRPQWMGYVAVDDVDAAVKRIAALGGVVHVPPTDVPNTSRFAIVADPQMATLALVRGTRPGERQAAAPGTPGRIGWHELVTADCEQALAFYGAVFGWRRARADVGPTGGYQLFSVGEDTIGGMLTKPATAPAPFWLYYFNVGDIDAAVARVKANGGRVFEGPLEAFGGNWIARCTDPQGAMFALEGRRERQPVGYFRRAGSGDRGQGGRWSW